MMRNVNYFGKRYGSLSSQTGLGSSLPHWYKNRTEFHQAGGMPLLASVLPTPTTMDHLPPRGYESMIKQTQVHRKGRTKLANLREAVNPKTVELFNELQSLPTPTSRDWKDGSYKSIKNCKKWDRLPVKTSSTSNSDSHEHSYSQKPNQLDECFPLWREEQLRTRLHDMFLNPHFVEEMMGYQSMARLKLWATVLCLIALFLYNVLKT